MSMFVMVPPYNSVLHFLCVPPSMIYVEGKVMFGCTAICFNIHRKRPCCCIVQVVDDALQLK